MSTHDAIVLMRTMTSKKSIPISLGHFAELPSVVVDLAVQSAS